MATPEELLRFPAFADLPEDQVAWFLSQSREVSLKAGEIYAKQGDPPDTMFVLLQGEFEWRGEIGGETVAFSGKVGDVTGALPFSRMKQYSVTGRALTDGRILRFPASQFPELIHKMPELAKRLVGVLTDRVRESTRLEQQRDRLAGQRQDPWRKVAVHPPSTVTIEPVMNDASSEARNVATRATSCACA